MITEAETYAAAERVRVYLIEQSIRPGTDHNVLGALGTADDILELRRADLELLLQHVLGEHVQTRGAKRPRGSVPVPEDALGLVRRAMAEANEQRSGRLSDEGDDL